MSGRQQRVMVQPIVSVLSLTNHRLTDFFLECYLQIFTTSRYLQFLFPYSINDPFRELQ